MRSSSRVSKAGFRFILLVNFSLFILFIFPLTNHLVDRGLGALKPLGLEDLVGKSLQVWLVGSTLAATALFLWMAWKQRSPQSDGPIFNRVRTEAMMLIAWLAIVAGVILYGLGLGGGG